MRISRALGSSGPTLTAGERDAAATADGVVEVAPALTVLDGPFLGQCYRLEGVQRSALIGRGTESHFVLPHPTVSRTHARVFVWKVQELEKAKIVDMNSRNGTYHNGVRVDEAVLEPGDKIHLGDVLLRFDLLDPTEVRFLDTMNARATEARLDPLTGLCRRSVLVQEARAALSQCQARGEPFCAIMIDLDRFKVLNDTFGHPVGDEALRLAGAAVKRSVREVDLAVRYGGEEMVVLLPGAGLSHGQVVAERIREAFRSQPIEGAAEWVLTASFGVAEGRFGEELGEIIRRADLALLAAKRAGRDRVAVAD
ncbi:MAG: GGDEF domain-containing protein [Candidatus Riflebacteria bacterium]|nr:GGDEF domain-containing protein [Candidatus Riflebacteria bacterium]